MPLSLKPNHAAVKAYYDTLHQLGQLHIDHEGAVRGAFRDLLVKCGRKSKLTLVPEYRIERARSSVIVDGAMLDLYHLPHGYWEAKDQHDDLEREVQRKFEKGYPRDNIIFQAPERAILYQAGSQTLDADISRPEPLVEVVNAFFDYKAPHILEWEDAVHDFSDRIPELAIAVKKTIDEERKRSPAFVQSFNDFYALCRQAINPNLSEDAVERMLVQHLLTERIFRKIFNNPDFTRRNVIAVEIEKVISELTRRSFNRDEFLHGLDRFYHAIEQSAESASGFSEKQAFLNTVYERFFQGYSPKEADTHGIVYTPQPIVNFMVRSVEEILQKEFGRSLGDKGVHILDPFVGTGNFIIRMMQEIKTTDLPYKYENELHCNEVMLLPYYIASMNIEHAYFDRTGEYKPFPGICMVDTFELAEPEQAQLGFMAAENAERVKRQKKAPIFVIIGNPPYNMGQVNENDNNMNRRYPAIDRRIAETYSRDSTATLKNKLSDPYVKAFRWASDRISDGVIAFVTNNSFIDQRAFDGMRKNLESTFDEIYILDLGGNVRKNPHISGTTHNVFGIQVGVSICLLIRRGGRASRKAEILYSGVSEELRKEEKLHHLDQQATLRQVPWTRISPDRNHNWLTAYEKPEFAAFEPLGLEYVKSGQKNEGALFRSFSLGVVTSRDAYVYSSSRAELQKNVCGLIDNYNSEVGRLTPENGKVKPTAVYSERLKWTDRLKDALSAGQRLEFESAKIRTALYRPFVGQWLYFDHLLNQRRYLQYALFPTEAIENENLVLALTGPASDKPFMAIATNHIADLHLVSPGCGTQCFPFYTYDEDGRNRYENITDWAFEQFRSRYHDQSITKWDIFHYVYGILHHPEYRERYAANLRRELPRIPFVSVGPDASNGANKALFRSFANTGKRLVEIHVNYEQQPEHKLKKIEKPGEKLDYCVTKMRLNKEKTLLVYNHFLTLSGIPPETFEYRLGNRSALEWVIDQYQVSTDKRSGITNDPNRPDDPTYILRLIGQVITVSLETVKLVRSLPPLGLPV
ncbi:MAG: type ISP restriction/modification enzyme [Candidatus Acidiferrales bacterium]